MVHSATATAFLTELKLNPSREFKHLVQIKLEKPIEITDVWKNPIKRLPLISAIQAAPSWPTFLNPIILSPQNADNGKNTNNNNDNNTNKIIDSNNNNNTDSNNNNNTNNDTNNEINTNNDTNNDIDKNTNNSNNNNSSNNNNATKENSTATKKSNRVPYWVDGFVSNDSNFLPKLASLTDLAMTTFDAALPNRYYDGDPHDYNNKTKKIAYLLFIGPSMSGTVAHYDEEDTFVIILQGSKRIETPAEYVDLYPGDVLYVPKFLQHSAVNTSDCVSISCNVSMVPEVVVPKIELQKIDVSPGFDSTNRIRLESIFSSLTLKELTKVSQVCKDWYAISSQNDIWKNWVPADMRVSGENLKEKYFSALFKVYSIFAAPERQRRKVGALLESGKISKAFLLSVLRYPCPQMWEKKRFFIGHMTTWGPMFMDMFRELLNTLPFQNISLVAALRLFCGILRLPGEAKQIDRMMEAFAIKYHECNPGAFSSSDTAYILSFSIIMLSTDQHNPNIKNKMSKETFITNNRGIDGGNDLPAQLLSEVFDDVASAGIMDNAYFRGKRRLFERPAQLQTQSFLSTSWSSHWILVDEDGDVHILKTQTSPHPIITIPVRSSEDIQVIANGKNLQIQFRPKTAKPGGKGVFGFLKEKDTSSHVKMKDQDGFDELVKMLQQFTTGKCL